LRTFINDGMNLSGFADLHAQGNRVVMRERLMAAARQLVGSDEWLEPIIERRSASYRSGRDYCRRCHIVLAHRLVPKGEAGVCGFCVSELSRKGIEPRAFEIANQAVMNGLLEAGIFVFGQES
jgi:hypothetical protein